MFNFLAAALNAQDNPVAAPRDSSMWQSMIMIVVAMVFLYFIMWRPEQKRRKEQEAQRSALKKGDKVTAVGIIGTVIRVQDQTVILKMYDGSKIEVLKAAINEVLPGTEEDSKKIEKEDAKKPEKEES